MEFNDKWTKEVNDKYRQMIKEKKSMDEIREYFGDLMKYHPEGKFNRGLFTYERFMLIVNEIKFYPNYIYFTFEELKSLRFPSSKDIICYFEINEVEYILLLEYLIENNNSFKEQVVYNVLFTTKEQYNKFKKIISNLSSEEMEIKYIELQDIIEKETNKGDVIKIFNALSYILLKMIDRLENKIYMISETTNIKKIKFYIKSIEDSFKDKYELIIDKSQFFDGKSYYFKIN